LLFHLFSPHAGGYVTFPASGGPYSVSTKPGPGTVIDLCGSDGRTIERGLYFDASGTGFADTAARGDEELGYDTLENNHTVTMRHPSQAYVTPRGANVTLENVSWGQAQFRIRKVGGSSGSRIRHGDTIALGAKQPYDPRRSPSAQQFRWLQADPEDNNPTTNPVILGGLSVNPGGASQRFTFLEGNLLAGEANLTVSDVVPPGEMIPSGALKLRLSHEGLPNGSTALVRFTSVNAAMFSFNSSGPMPFNASAPPFAINVPPGTRELSLPLNLISPTLGDPCARFAAFLNGTLVGPGALTVVDAGMESWTGSSHDGATPRGVGINSARAADWFDISMSGSAGELFMDGAIFIGGADDIFTVTVRSRRGVSLPPVPGPIPTIAGSGYTISVVAMPFPAPGFATDANTPPPVRVSGDSPILTLARNRSFVHRTRFRALPRGTADMFCIQVDIQPYRRTLTTVRLSRRIGLRVF
jgi:hypothetical protein